MHPSTSNTPPSASTAQSPGGNGPGNGTGKPDDKAKDVVVTVNLRPVPLPDRTVTGLKIKQAAIGAGLPIDAGFVLLVDEDDGGDRVVGDDETIKINKNSTFTAIAPDDNS